MTDIQTISWIFLAISMATNTKPTDINGISSVADGINHAVPTQKELQRSISWLITHGLIIKEGKNYKLTAKGKHEYETASYNTQTVMKIWENIEQNLKGLFESNEAITKQDCIIKVCNVPLDFKLLGKSSLTLLRESNFAAYSNDISPRDIKDYLLKHKTLIDEWQTWSENKRTSGYYLSINADKYLVGSFDKDGKDNFSKSFATAEDACAEFILREVNAILGITNE
jgi:hypothetical protein